MHTETVVAGTLGLAPMWHHPSISAQMHEGITFAAAVRIAPSTKMGPTTCCTCKQKCTDGIRMHAAYLRFTPIAMAPCHPVMYNQSFLYTQTVLLGITRSHGTRPAMLRVIQVRHGAMQAVHEVLLRMPTFVQTSGRVTRHIRCEFQRRLDASACIHSSEPWGTGQQSEALVNHRAAAPQT